MLEAKHQPKTEVSNKDLDPQLKASVISDEEVQDLVKRIGDLEDDFKKHKFDLQKALLNLQEQLSQKATLE